ncbi:hypothetical protein JW766_02970 [Candidatus Dojkabacteria bacterium]|nr:hypothetical protein [Candidatus Dojkabacteria bacterium]
MSVINKLSSSLSCKDEAPNKKLASQLIAKKDKKGIKGIAQHLKDEDSKIQKDCLSVFEYIADEEPALISPYGSDLLDLLNSKSNALVWGAMIVLARITDRIPEKIWAKRKDIVNATETGSVITQDNGIKILAKVAAAQKKYEKELFPLLLKYLMTCRPKSVAQFAESIFVTVNDKNKKQFLDILNKRMLVLSKSQQSRINKISKRLK